MRRWETGTQGGDTKPVVINEYGDDDWATPSRDVRQKHVDSLDRLHEEEGTLSVEEEDESKRNQS
jgi:hypothetical protein